MWNFSSCGLLTGSVALGITQILPSLLPITANSASLLVDDDVGASEHQTYSMITQSTAKRQLHVRSHHV
jgi:hypothetical protein